VSDNINNSIRVIILDFIYHIFENKRLFAESGYSNLIFFDIDCIIVKSNTFDIFVLNTFYNRWKKSACVFTDSKAMGEDKKVPLRHIYLLFKYTSFIEASVPMAIFLLLHSLHS